MKDTRTDRDGIEFVKCALGEHAQKHDVENIADGLHKLIGSWDFEEVDTALFWRVVEANAKR